MMPMLSAFTEVFASPGSRTSGNGAQAYAITGPHWHGDLPPGLTRIEAPTDMVWIAGRVYSSGEKAALAAAQSFQDRLMLVPLSSYGKSYKPNAASIDPGFDMKTGVRAQVDAMKGPAFFNLLSELLEKYPPSPADKPMLERIARLGVVPGRTLDADTLAPVIGQAMSAAAAGAQKKISMQFATTGEQINGWKFTTQTGRYGTDYLQRAMIAAIGLGANLPNDAIYPTSVADAAGKPYLGNGRYEMHFEKGQLPPVKGFWSLTLYDPDYYFVPNQIDRHTLSSRSEFKLNDDGSVDLIIQKNPPGPDKSSNWLPAPEGPFILMLRLYWPNESAPTIMDGSWKPPAVRKLQ